MRSARRPYSEKISFFGVLSESVVDQATQARRLKALDDIGVEIVKGSNPNPGAAYRPSGPRGWHIQNG